MDLVLDPIGGSHLQKSYATLRRGGRLISYGFQQSDSRIFVLASLMRYFMMKWMLDGRQAFFYSITAMNRKEPSFIREDLGKLFGMLGMGVIKPIIDKCFALQDARKAHERLGQGEAVGKIMLMME